MAQLYLITPETYDASIAAQFKEICEVAAPAVLQLRLKNASEAEVIEASEALIPICTKHDVAFILNDSPELAAKVGAAGVHLGEDDMPYKEARALLGKDAIIGVSCYDSRHDAMQLAEAGADYVAFGAVFDTQTKTPKAKAPLDLLKWWSDYTTVPGVAIGGITPENAKQVIDTGIDFIAVINSVWNHPDGVAAAAKAFDQLLS